MVINHRCCDALSSCVLKQSKPKHIVKAEARISAWLKLARKGCSHISSCLARLNQLTEWRIYRTSRVLLCTVDSVARVVYGIEDASEGAEKDGHTGWTFKDAGVHSI